MKLELVNSWEYIKPYIDQIIGKDKNFKDSLYNELNDFKKAIFSFYVYYNHAKRSFTNFKIYTKLFIESNDYDIIINGAKYFKNKDYASLLILINNSFIKKPTLLDSNLYDIYMKESLLHINKMDAIVKSSTQLRNELEYTID